MSRDVRMQTVRDVTEAVAGWVFYGQLTGRWIGYYRRTNPRPYERRHGPTKHEGFATQAEAEDAVRRCFERDAASARRSRPRYGGLARAWRAVTKNLITRA